jgi:hypothetical protein
MRSLNKISRIVVLASVAGPLADGATITGTVKGPDDAPFRGAFVQAQNMRTRVTVDVLSDKDGRYEVENLPAGSRQITG